jgi:hypothetical protein
MSIIYIEKDPLTRKTGPVAETREIRERAEFSGMNYQRKKLLDSRSTLEGYRRALGNSLAEAYVGDGAEAIKSQLIEVGLDADRIIGAILADNPQDYSAEVAREQLTDKGDVGGLGKLAGLEELAACVEDIKGFAVRTKDPADDDEKSECRSRSIRGYLQVMAKRGGGAYQDTVRDFLALTGELNDADFNLLIPTIAKSFSFEDPVIAQQVYDALAARSLTDEQLQRFLTEMLKPGHGVALIHSDSTRDLFYKFASRMDPEFRRTFLEALFQQDQYSALLRVSPPVLNMRDQLLELTKA